MDQNQASPPAAPSLRQRIRRVVLDIHNPPFYIFLAAILTFVVECLSRHSIIDTFVFLWSNPLAYLTNFGIILLTLLPALLFRKRLAGMALMTAIWLTLGVAQCIILYTRISPLSAADIAVAFSVITIITSYLSWPVIILIILAIVGLIVALVLFFIKAKRHPVRLLRFITVYVAAVLGTAAILAAGFASGKISDRFPNLATAYNDYGFPYCFSMSVVDKGVDKPDEYEEDITDILEDLPTGDDLPPAAPGERGPNVIMVQLESFFDVNYIEGVTYTENPVPHFTALREQYPSGILYVPVIGAGTVNTEFEVLTGMNVDDFGAGEYPFRSILRNTTCESIAYDLLRSGYRTHAIHNHEGTFYSRNDVYKNLGFESFTSIEYFKDPTYNSTGWAHDALLTDEILYLLDSTDESDFVFAVSVQGHGKYPDDYVPEDGDVLITGGLDNELTESHFNYYINELREMDAFVHALAEAVLAMEEDTVLVFYGDHLPSIVRDEGIVLSTTEFETEYIIISNYETPAAHKGGSLYTYQLFPAVMEMIGNDEGVINQFHRVYRDSEEYLSLLASLEYDALYGHRLLYGDREYPHMEHMTMGGRPMTVTGYETDGEYLYVKGENFTSFCTVLLDGRVKKTEFVDEHTLRVADKNPDRLLERTEEIAVRVVSSKNEILSETPALAVQNEE